MNFMGQIAFIVFFVWSGQQDAFPQASATKSTASTSSNSGAGTTVVPAKPAIVFPGQVTSTTAPSQLSSRDPILEAKLTLVTSSLDDIKRKLDAPKQESWFRDFAPVLVSLFSVVVAGAALVFSRRHNDRTLSVTRENHERSLLEKAREEERKSIREKLDQFYGPMIQLRGVSQALYEILNARRQGPADLPFRNKAGLFRTLHALLNGATFSGVDKTLLDEIVKIGEASGKLIAEKVGLVDDPKLQNLLWKVAAHYRILALAVEGKLEGGGAEFDKMSFPHQINIELEKKTKELNDRLERLQQISLESIQNSATIHPVIEPETSQAISES